jgi:hypothetical protein
LKVQRKLEETQVTTTNPFKRLQKEQEKKKSLEEARKIARTGIISLDDFIAVLNDFEFRQKNRDIIIKFLKALQCYFPHNSTVYYFKVLRQLSRRVNHFSKITRTFEYVKPIVSIVFLIDNFSRDTLITKKMPQHILRMRLTN